MVTGSHHSLTAVYIVISNTISALVSYRMSNTGACLISILVCCSTTALLTLQHPPKAPPLSESDSECYTDTTTSFSESDDDLHLDEDLNMDGSLEQEEVQDANVGQQDTMQDTDVGQTQDILMEIRKVEVQDAPVGPVLGRPRLLYDLEEGPKVK